MKHAASLKAFALSAEKPESGQFSHKYKSPAD